MPTDQEPRDEATRFMFYSLAAAAVMAVAAFIYLFNFTSFFRLAVPL
jgi:hypothetical protein